MKYHYKTTQHKASLLSVACFVLFVAYSAFMYLLHQPGIVVLTYFIESGMASSSLSNSTAWISAVLGTFLCSIPAMVLLSCFHFPLRLKALAFIPSYIILGLATGISPESIASEENDIPVFSAIILLLLSAISIYISRFLHEDRGEHAPIPNYLGANIFISCIGMLFCIMLTNTDRQLHVQLDMANHIYHGDYSVVADFNKGETTSNNTITSMQVLSLSKQGKLADELFSLPQLKGSCSLLPDTVPSSLVYNIPTLVYQHLRAVPVGVYTSATSFLEKAVARRLTALSDTTVTQKDSVNAQPLMDYYLCALLLDKDLKRFSDELPKHYKPSEPLPYHYKEALTLCGIMEIPTQSFLPDTTMNERYIKFQELRDEHKDDVHVQRKACTNAFPDTYWNYYFFVNLR